MDPWLPSPQDVSLADQMHIWRISLEGERSDQVLAAAEVARANRFKFERDRRRFVASRVGLRSILARYLGCDAAAVEFDYGEYGKPSIPQRPDLQFNLSHSGEWALCGVMLHHQIGIDIEALRPLTQLSGLSRRCLTAREMEGVDPESAEDFLQLWTCKEAYLKAVGCGLTQPLQSVEVQLMPQPQLLQVPEAGRWHLQVLHPGAGYVAAVVSARQQEMTCFNWEW